MTPLLKTNLGFNPKIGCTTCNSDGHYKQKSLFDFKNKLNLSKHGLFINHSLTFRLPASSSILWAQLENYLN